MIRVLDAIVSFDGTNINLEGYSEPTRSILQAAFDAGSYEVIPVVVPPPIEVQPREIDARRLRIALSRLGYLTSVEALVAQADKETQINWESSTFIVEDFPLVQGLIATLELTKANVDEIFELALALT